MKITPWLIGGLGLWLSSCASLQPVNTFSTSVLAGLGEATTLPAQFTNVYRQRIVDDSLDKHPFNRIPLIGINFADRVRHDSLRSYQRADSLTALLTTLLSSYFQALTDLSATGKTAPTVQLNASPAFNGFLQSSAVKLTTDQVVAINQLVSLLGAGLTGAYRRRQLTRLLENSHAAVRQVLTAQAFAYERLAAVVDISRDQQYGHYKNELIRDTKLTYGQKHDLAERWLRTSQTILRHQQTIAQYAQLLSAVRAGYDILYEYRHQLTKKALSTAMSPYVSTISRLQAGLEQQRVTHERSDP